MSKYNKLVMIGTLCCFAFLTNIVDDIPLISLYMLSCILLGASVISYSASLESAKVKVVVLDKRGVIKKEKRVQTPYHTYNLRPRKNIHY